MKIRDIFQGPSKEDFLKKIEQYEYVEKVEDTFLYIGVDEHDLDIMKKCYEKMKELGFTTSQFALNSMMDEAIKSEHLEMLELALKFGANINHYYEAASFIFRAIFDKMSPEMVKLMLKYDDINRSQYEKIYKYLNNNRPLQNDNLKKIEEIIQKYNPSYES